MNHFIITWIKKLQGIYTNKSHIISISFYFTRYLVYALTTYWEKKVFSLLHSHYHCLAPLFSRYFTGFFPFEVIKVVMCIILLLNSYRLQERISAVFAHKLPEILENAILIQKSTESTTEESYIIKLLIRTHKVNKVKMLFTYSYRVKKTSTLINMRFLKTIGSSSLMWSIGFHKEYAGHSKLSYTYEKYLTEK